MFLGRQKELALLEEQYASDRFSFVPIYGRRRIGKTELIRKFLNGKKHIYYQATKSNEGINLEQFSNVVGQSLFGSDMSFPTITIMLDAITNYIQDHKLVFVIDEYPYLAEKVDGLNSIMQKYIDHDWHDNPNMMLILSGSSMSFMENQVLGYKSPLYGRRTGQIKLLPFYFNEVQEFFPEMPLESLVEYFAITGGVPYYLVQINAGMTVEGNIKALFFSTGGLLYEEPLNLLKQELTDSSAYTSMLFVMARGATKITEIADKAGIKAANASKYMNDLEKIGITERITPVTVPTTKRPLYVIKDPMFQFWFKFVQPNLSFIEIGETTLPVKQLERDFSQFVGRIFEQVCQEWTLRHLSELDLKSIPENFGKWWGNNPSKRRQEGVDIVATNESEHYLLVGECKWTKTKVDVDVLSLLIERSNLIGNYLAKDFILFSKNGFTDECVEESKKFGAQLIPLNDM
jgi:AAA+ ATPase superfamily predicted ATPase